jgi:Disulphide bond corrector protein DsbC
MIRSSILIVTLLLISLSSKAQMAEPVRWSYSSEKIGADEYKVVFTAQIQEGWFVYSQFLASDDGPVKTTFSYDTKDIELKGKTEEFGHKKEGFDAMYGMQIVKFSGNAEFVQIVKTLGSSVDALKAKVTYMTCNDQTCIPPRDVPFNIPLTK